MVLARLCFFIMLLGVMTYYAVTGRCLRGIMIKGACQITRREFPDGTQG